MKRSMCGLVVLAAATALWSCNGDPTDNIRGAPRVLADPASVFLDEGDAEFVVVQIVDEQGNQLTSNFQAQNVGSGITVEKDTTFLETTIGTHLETSSRFVVSGLTPASTSFELVSGEQTITIPVRVLPTSFTATMSTVAPAQNEPVTFTAPAGFTFASDAVAIFGADTAVTTSVAADGTTMTVVPRPALAAGSPIKPIISGARSALYSSIPLSIPILDSLTLPVAAAVAGTEDPTTAPVITAPGVGQTAAFFDLPDFAATIDHFYQINVVEAGDYQVTVDWTIGNDVDAPVCVADPTCANETFTDPTVSAAHPETGVFTLPVGISTLFVEDFGAIQHLFGFPPGTPAIGALLKITITRL